MADSPADPASLVGQTLRDEYHLVSVIGSGAFGDVYLAEQLSGGTVMRPAVVKVLRPDRRAVDDAVQRFHREAQLLARINHPNVVTLYNFGQIREGLLFLAMELGGDRTLADLMRAEGPLPVGRTLHIAEQICEALGAAARQGIIHRDLKPSNILLRREDDEDRIKVVDFGIAKMVRDLSADEDANTVVSLTSSEAFIGTPAYTSPEQAAGGVVDARSDLYALGVVLYEMLTGSKPFQAANSQAMLAAHNLSDPKPPMQVVPLPVPVNDMVTRLLAKRPDDRYQSARALQREIARLRSTRLHPATRVRRKLTMVAVGAGLAALLAIGLTELVARHRASTPAARDTAAIVGPQLQITVEEPVGATITPSRWPLRGAGSVKLEVSGTWTLLIEYEPKGPDWHLYISSLPLAAVRVDGTLDGNRGEADISPGGNGVAVQLKARERVLRLTLAVSG